MLAWLLLALLSTAAAGLSLGRPKESGETLAVMAQPAVLQAYSEDCRLFVDGREILDRGRSPDGKKNYALAEEFLAALDEEFWAGEKESLDYEPLEYGGKEYLCVEDFCSAHGIREYYQNPGESCWVDSAAGEWSIPEGVRAPVLMYHGVGNELWTTPELFVRPEELEEQIQWLLERGYTPIWFQDLKHLRFSLWQATRDAAAGP